MFGYRRTRPEDPRRLQPAGSGRSMGSFTGLASWKTACDWPRRQGRTSKSSPCLPCFMIRAGMNEDHDIGHGLRGARYAPVATWHA